jgi:hypothetical protein
MKSASYSFLLLAIQFIMKTVCADDAFLHMLEETSGAIM